MTILESIFYTMWRGLAIGIIISAPMGPVGILCIQRTLDKGRRTGFYTGVGAAISDLLYCLLTGFGLSLVEDFLERNHDIIQLAGSLVLIAFGIFLFKKNPAKTIKPPTDIQSQGYKKDILYGFLFTVSNPLIIFLIIGLFARFNFMVPDIKFYNYILGYVGIFVGALLWWWMVSTFINKVRAHFNMRSMWLINRVIASIILIFAAVGIASSVISLTSQKAKAETLYFNRSRSYLPFKSDKGDELLLDDNYSQTFDSIPADIGKNDFSLQFRAKSKGSWAVALKDTVSRNELVVEVSTKESATIIDSSRKLIIKTRYGSGGVGNVERCKSLSTAVDCNGGFNTLRISRNEDNQNVFIGNKDLKKLTGFSFKNLDVNQICFRKLSTEPLEISDIILELESRAVAKYNDIENLKTRLSISNDVIEGIWHLRDKEFDTAMMSSGGDYTLAIVKSAGGYDVVYLDGAEINEERWVAGMVKATMKQSVASEIYDIEWRDASFTKISKDVYLQMLSNDLISITFPLQNAKFVFKRVM